MYHKVKKKKYWNKFYSQKKPPKENSPFAFFCTKILKDKKEIIFDIGCGNGRDTIFFLKKKYKCFGIDQSKSVILKNKKQNKTHKKYFICKDLSKINFDKIAKGKFSIYSRFSLHAINYQEEKKLFENIFKSKNLNYLMIETRTIYDELFGVGKRISKNEYITDHYRRFIEPKKLKKVLEKKFKLKKFYVRKNLAKYKKENPKVLRAIFKNVR